MPVLEKRLTDSLAVGKQCAAPGKGYAIYWCPKTPGFGVRVTHDGFRSWVLERRLNGKTVRRTLGAVSGSGRNAISAEAARGLAVQRSGELVQGRDVALEQRAAAKLEKTTGLSFGDALRQFVSDTSSRNVPLAERTKTDYLAMIAPEAVGPSGRLRRAGELESVADTRLDRITGPAIKALYQQLQKRGPTRAAYAMRVLRGVLNYHGVRLEDDPFAKATAGRDRIRLPKPNARSRRIPPERLASWWKAASAAENGDKFQFMVLTGVRPGETSAIKVSDVDVTGGRVAIADPTRPYVVLLSKQAKAIAKGRVAGKKPEELLFDQAADPRKSIARIIRESSVPFSPHDCRRTFSSIAASALPGYTVKRLMNHANGNDVTAAHYVNLDEATLRGAWQAVADIITKKASQRAPKRGDEKVVPITRRVASAA